MDIQTLAAHADRILDEHIGFGHGACRPLPELILLRHLEQTPRAASIYEPVICLILQGGKEVVISGSTVRLEAGESMLVSHDLPVISRITSARPEQPYLALVLVLDMALLRGLYDEVGEALVDEDEVHSVEVHRADAHMVDALGRALGLVDDPVGARVLLPLLKRELHFRLLMAPGGGMLRRLLRHDSHASSVARAIAHLRKHFRATIPVPDLAREVGMSPSSLHRHFKAITSTSPLQYQKDLRLLEARRLLVAGQHAVSDVAYEVGYESPSQFSREYSRKFGVSPCAELPSTRELQPEAV